MSRQLNPSQIWSQVPVANRLIEVNTKTGFSLTAGSYSVRASSAQYGSGGMSNGVTSVTSTISSVTTTRATVAYSGTRTQTNGQSGFAHVTLTNSTTLTSQRSASQDETVLFFNVMEYF